jgi:ech hydrogenase subunit A
MLTFLFVSLVGVTEQNTKKVLAYSTIGSLGLIVGCAGLGSPELIWVGVMIIIFHALAKGLLFLVVGTIENRLYSKDMENFDTLLSRLPLVSALALTGIAGMFIAPFGVVVAKWTAIRAFLDIPGWQGAALLVIMAFGTSLTLFYWGKLLIKVLSMRTVSEYELSVQKRITRFEWLAEITLAVGVIAVAAFIGVISEQVVGPQALATFKGTSQAFLHVEPVMLTTMVVAMLFLPALALWASRQKHYDMSDFYAAGRPVTSTGVMGMALGGSRTVSLRNYYLEGVVNGGLVFRAGTLVCGVLLIAAASRSEWWSADEPEPRRLRQSSSSSWPRSSAACWPESTESPAPGCKAASGRLCSSRSTTWASSCRRTLARSTPSWSHCSSATRHSWP